MDISAIMKAKSAWETFTRNHPKFPMFLNAVRRDGIKEGTLIEISVVDPDGSKKETNVRVTASDLELLNMLSAR